MYHMKYSKFVAMSLMTLSFLGSYFFNVAKVQAADTTCSPACVSPLVCVSGACSAPSHVVSSNAPIASSSVQSSGNTTIPGATQSGGIIQCGRPGQSMCTLCDLIRGMNIIIHYLMQIAIGVALLAMAIGGVLYIVSAGDGKLIDQAKAAIKNAAIGFVIIFGGYLIINTTISYLGAKTDAQGNPTFGMSITSWGNFDCKVNSNR